MIPSGTQTVGAVDYLLFSIHTASSYSCASILFRAEFTDMDFPELQIKDATGRVVYLGSSTENTILWVWRELLLSSIIRSSSDTVAKKIVVDMKKLKLTTEMLKRLDDETLRA